MEVESCWTLWAEREGGIRLGLGEVVDEEAPRNDNGDDDGGGVMKSCVWLDFKTGQ